MEMTKKKELNEITLRPKGKMDESEWASPLQKSDGKTVKIKA